MLGFIIGFSIVIFVLGCVFIVRNAKRKYKKSEKKEE